MRDNQGSLLTSSKNQESSSEQTIDGLNVETKLVFALNMARMVEEVSDPETKAILKAILNQLAMSLIKTEKMH